jgi:outer membrane immunogenic protein
MMYNWTGCYIGANAGYSWGRGSVDVNAPSLGFPFGANFDMNGFIGGGQVGCNWQYSNAVWGLETDFQGSAQKGSRAAAFNFSEPSGLGLAYSSFRPFCFTGRADLLMATSR